MVCKQFIAIPTNLCIPKTTFFTVPANLPIAAKSMTYFFIIISATLHLVFSVYPILVIVCLKVPGT